jgi:hypothetical protein
MAPRITLNTVGVEDLASALGDHAAPGIELADNVATPDDVAEILARAERAGATVVRERAPATWGDHRRFRQPGRLRRGGRAPSGVDAER